MRADFVFFTLVFILILLEVITIEIQKSQMSTVLSEIKQLRGMQNFVIDRKNSNRYRIMVREKLGYTAYCFSTPIYNTDTRKLIQLNFTNKKNGYIFKGSNATVTVSDNRCVLENKEGKVVLFFNENPSICGSNKQTNATIDVAPTMNGLRFIVKGRKLNFFMSSEIVQSGVRFNSGCLSIMKEQFRPFVSLSTLYARNRSGTVTPVEMRYEEVKPSQYALELFHDLNDAVFMFEVNLYESKLFQDTTVESLHPDKNNVFGSVGFIGKTKQFGEQWLYSRPDFSKIPDFSSDRVDQVLLHIPILNGSEENLDVYIPQQRFCSFGSTWKKRINASEKVATSNNHGRYISIDVTSMFTNRIDQTLTYNEGLILKKPKGKSNFIAISTGDCYSAPQILELKFKK